MLFIGTALLTFIAAGTKSVKEAQSYMSMLMLLPIVPTVILMVSPIRTQLLQYTVPFLAQNQMLLKVIRSETIAPLEWAVYFGAGFDLARSEEHTSELPSLMRISYAVLCVKQTNNQ